MNKILKIYKQLYTSFGKQHWWPTILEGELHPSYHGKGVLNGKQRFEIIIGAILTQNTSWKNVEKAINKLHKTNLIDIKKLSKINIKRLASLIKSSGYYNQKAERLKIIAKFIINNKNPTRDELLNLKGIGPETADSILLYAFNKPVFVIDAYTKRIMQRIGYKEGEYDKLQKLFENNLPKKYRLFNEYHALLVELGKNHCRKKPVCKECPIQCLCSGKINK